MGSALLVGAAPHVLSVPARASTVVEGADSGLAAEAVHEVAAAAGRSTRVAWLRAAPVALALAVLLVLLRRRRAGAWRPGVWPAPANRPPPVPLH